ncbi:MAG: hypothetical protein OHK0046_47770 [Anaerolineae bacterium]
MTRPLLSLPSQPINDPKSEDYWFSVWPVIQTAYLHRTKMRAAWKLALLMHLLRSMDEDNDDE